MKKNDCFKPFLLMVMMVMLTGCVSIKKDNSQVEMSSTEMDDLYQPERQLYFTCKNINSDIYLMNTNSPHLNFSIYSTKALDIDSISVNIDIETDYTLTVYEYPQHRILSTEFLDDKTDMNLVTFPYYIYQSYRGTDWEKMQELYQADAEAEDPIHKEEAENLLEYQMFWAEGYKKITKENLPVFHWYHVIINFGKTDTENEANIVSEKFNELTVNIGEEKYVQNIGEIRIHSESFENLEGMISVFADKENMINLSGVQLEYHTYPYGDGKMYEILNSFQAKNDMSLTNVYFYESEIQPIGAHVIISEKAPTMFSDSGLQGTISAPNIGTTDFYWDFTSSIDIVKGSFVTIEIIYQDPRLTELEYGGRFYPVMEYTVGNNSYKMYTEMCLDRLNLNMCWLRYAIVFGGLDMESYFNDYYYPVYETWREEVPW